MFKTSTRWLDGPNWPRQFGYQTDFDDDFPGIDIDEGHWHNAHTTHEGNTIEAEGGDVAAFTALVDPTGGVSKAQLIRYYPTPMGEGSRIDATVAMWIDTVTPDLFLLDIESDSAFRTSPGLRVKINKAGVLAIDRSKLGIPTDWATAKRPPARTWFTLQLALHLSTRTTVGRCYLGVNGLKVLEAAGATLFPDDLTTVRPTGDVSVNKINLGVTATSKYPAIVKVDRFRLCR